VASHGPAGNTACSTKRKLHLLDNLGCTPLDSRPTPWDGKQTGGRYLKWWLWTMTMLYS